MKWQTIETAPKDGKEYLLWSETEGGLFVAFWHSIWECWIWTTHDIGDDRMLMRATHWMRLPAPPDA
jgi:hypothetical protein